MVKVEAVIGGKSSVLKRVKGLRSRNLMGVCLLIRFHVEIVVSDGLWLQTKKSRLIVAGLTGSATDYVINRTIRPTRW